MTKDEPFIIDLCHSILQTAQNSHKKHRPELDIQLLVVAYSEGRHSRFCLVFHPQRRPRAAICWQLPAPVFLWSEFCPVIWLPPEGWGQGRMNTELRAPTWGLSWGQVREQGSTPVSEEMSRVEEG